MSFSQDVEICGGLEIFTIVYEFSHLHEEIVGDCTVFETKICKMRTPYTKLRRVCHIYTRSRLYKCTT